MSKWNNKLMFPREMYTLRVIEEELKTTEKGAPMLSLTFEIVHPEEAMVDGALYEVVGQRIWNNQVFRSYDKDGSVNATKTAKCQEMAKNLYDQFEVPITDFDNPPLGLKGKLVYALVYGKQQDITKSPTAEELKNGIKVGKPILDPRTQQPIKKTVLAIDSFYGKAELPAGVAF